jgi:hypothetical protein
MFWPAILFLILVAIFGRNVFRAIWWIIGPAILAIVGLAWFGSTLPDQPKRAAVDPTPTTNCSNMPIRARLLAVLLQHQRQHQRCSNMDSTKSSSLLPHHEKTDRQCQQIR